MTIRLSHSVRTVRRTEDTHCRGVGQKASDRQHSELEDVPRETERARRSNLFAGSHTGLGRPHCLVRKSSYMVHWYSQTEFLHSSSYLCPCMLVCLRRLSKEDQGAMVGSAQMQISPLLLAKRPGVFWQGDATRSSFPRPLGTGGGGRDKNKALVGGGEGVGIPGGRGGKSGWAGTDRANQATEQERRMRQDTETFSFPPSLLCVVLSF